MKTKMCSKCKIEKELCEFVEQKSHKYGVSSYCSICSKKYNKQYYLKNKEKIKHKVKSYRDTNIKEIQIKNSKYYHLNKK